jgi:hypothetical protein
LISNISEYSNSQSKVTTVDLRSRNPQLNKIKALSESVITPSGRKWFFEKSKGEFNTKLRIAGQSGKNRIEKEYPKEFRFTKEQLGKYFCSWGDEPYKVKKGGEAIFRKFLEFISSDESSKKIVIDRDFYQSMISKIILFKSLEEIHGSRNNAIGQLRSAVVPYTISILYSKTDGDKKLSKLFDLNKLWINEGVEDDLGYYLKELMILVNSLITDKRFAKSDDFGEYSKKKDLWDDIISSNELKTFLTSNNSISIFNKYTKEKGKKKDSSNTNLVDFSSLAASIEIYSKGQDFYKNIRSKYDTIFSNYEINKISRIITSIQKEEDLTQDLIEFNKDLMFKIRMNHTDFLEIQNEYNEEIVNSFNHILQLYNNCLNKEKDIVSAFILEQTRCEINNFKYCSVFGEIGKNLINNIAPSIKQIID